MPQYQDVAALPDPFVMECLDVARGCGVEDVNAVFSQPLVGMLDHLVHVLVVLPSILESDKNCFQV